MDRTKQPAQPDNKITQTRPKFRTVIVGNNPGFCSTLSAYLSALPGFEIIGVVRTGWDALQLNEEKGPDLLLTDFTLGDMSGAALCKALRTRPTGPAVVVMSRHNSKDYMEISMNAGADGYMLKHEMDKLPDLLRHLVHKPRRK